MNGRPPAAGTPGSSVPSLVVRAIRPDDTAGLQAFHGRLSAETIRKRFFGAHPRLPDEEAKRFTCLGPGQVALVATRDEQIIGVSRYIRLGTTAEAEVAFVVEDGYQGRGIGTELFGLMARIAWDDGVRRFVAETLADNRAMLDVFRRTPDAATVSAVKRDGGVFCLTMQVTPPATALTRSGDRQ